MKSRTEIVKKKYDMISSIYDCLSWPAEKLFLDRWRRAMVYQLKGKTLEIGIGTGRNLEFYSNSANVTGIDISQRILDKAAYKAKVLKKDYSFFQMDAQDLKFKDNTFDNVVCTFVLCSVPDPVKTLSEMRRVCKPKGKLLMIEHVLSKKKLIALYQHLHNPFTKFFFGFNINRDTINNIKKGGLKIIKEENIAFFDIFKFIICKPGKTN